MARGNSLRHTNCLLDRTSGLRLPRTLQPADLRQLLTLRPAAPTHTVESNMEPLAIYQL